jgi:glycolate oxidase iron-sulfur subunit
MQTNFSLAQLADPHVAESEKILRTCVHCGFCTATCPTYVLLGDELDSPRGRIYLIKDMLENDRPANEEVVKHVDRCLSCLSCMTTCPSGVHYMHLVDHARTHIEQTYQRPLKEKLTRAVLAKVLPNPTLFRLSLFGARLAKPFAPLFRAVPGLKQLAAMVELAPSTPPTRSPMEGPRVFKPEGPRKGRVAILSGCANPVLDPDINDATVRMLLRHDIEVVLPAGEGCCGALVHHMGREEPALDAARRNVDVWTRELEGEGLDAILITASGCGTTVKDYGFMLRLDAAYADKAARVSGLTKDVTEYLSTLELKPVIKPGLVVAYHSACSMQHGQQIKTLPQSLLGKVGFVVKNPAEGHLCCGSAGVYNILQPDIAAELRARKVRNIEATKADVIAAGNLGCITQIALGTSIPLIHTAELLDWATGGPVPAKIAGLVAARAEARAAMTRAAAE